MIVSLPKQSAGEGLSENVDPFTGYHWALPKWTQKINPKTRMTLVSSGRGGGGKSVAFGYLMLKWACESRKRILCCREVQRSLRDSSLQILKNWIMHPNAPWAGSNFIKVRESKSTIYLANGSEIIFSGLSSSHGTAQSIKSLEGIDICWVDEAQHLTDKSMELLLPTIRKTGSRLYMSYNPSLPSDPVSKLASTADSDEGIDHIFLTFNDNPFFKGSELDQERIRCEKYQPEVYNHIWLGEFQSENPNCLATYYEAMACWDEWNAQTLAQARGGFIDAGQDLAVSPTGDKNVFVERTGSVVTKIKRWLGSEYKQTANRILGEISPQCETLYVDAGGVGAPFKGYLEQDAKFPIKVEAVNFGGKVKGEEVRYTPGITNTEKFARRNSQLYWSIRLRIKNTMRFIGGEDVDLNECLFIPKHVISFKEMEELAAQISAATYQDSKTGKLEIEKAPKDADSPDLLDGLVLAFAYDSHNGLRENLDALEWTPSVRI